MHHAAYGINLTVHEFIEKIAAHYHMFYDILLYVILLPFSISIFNTRERVGNNLIHPHFLVNEEKMYGKKYNTEDFFLFTKSIILFFQFNLEVIWTFTVGIMISQIILMTVKNGGALLFGAFMING